MSAEGACRRLARDHRGSAALEFAIVAPILILLMIGILVVGWTMHNIQSMRLALEQAGRALQIDQALTEVQLSTMVRATLERIGDSNVTVAVSDDTSVEGLLAKRLTATYIFQLKLPFLGTYDLSYATSVTVPLVPELG